MSLIPAEKPHLPHLTALNMLGAAGLSHHKGAFLAIRGYYPNTFGKADANDRKVYDDYLAWVEGGLYLPVNANTDPNGFRPGYGTSENTKGILSICDGQVCWYRSGQHKGRPAFRQARDFWVWRDADVTKVPKERVIRVDGVPVYKEFGSFAANIHDSPEGSTSSLGCITVPKSQFGPWRTYVYARMKELGLFGEDVPLYMARNQDLK
jgi:hypothetical protein